MIDFSISIVPLIVVALVNFFLSWVYYSPMVPWFRTWQLGVGADPNKTQMTAEDMKDMPRLMGGAVIATILFAFGLQVLVHSLRADTLSAGLAVGFLVWLGFVVTHSLNTQFEGRKPSVLLINNVLYLLSYCAFGAIFAVWH
jgi:UDP-N-acetylmuramyl pentapeptide phosphotransferase/UDP-N-acetylglucosamine-1-phosphate transferase